jgi:hypothetical protein
MRFKKTDWLRWAVGGLVFVAVGMTIALWLSTKTVQTFVAEETSGPEQQLGRPITPAPMAEPAPGSAPPAPAAPAPSGEKQAAPPVIARAPEVFRQPASPPADKPPERPPGDSASMTPAVKEELGRWALNHVGADDAATEIWLELINDPELSAKVRQDLIEDLNENGFSGGNGRTATVDDLPLIASRIQLIEEHAAAALDETNAAAFAEAYKDLVNLWQRLSQQ